MKKRAVFALFCLLISIVALFASSCRRNVERSDIIASDIVCQQISVDLFDDGVHDEWTVEFVSNSTAYDFAYEKMYTAMIATETRCDISAYGITVDTIAGLYADIINHSPELFYMANNLTYGASQSTGKVVYVEFVYTMDIGDITSAKEFYNEQVEDIIAEMPIGLDDFGKALWLNDYICLNFSYDNTLSKSDVYTFLKDGEGVCRSYSLLYMELLNRCGIENDCVLSDAMAHMWSVVRIDGQWYHVDVTWNDAGDYNGNDVPGRALHDMFLCSDSGIQNTDHYGYDVKYSCTDTKYENTDLSRIENALAYVDGRWYAYDGTTKNIVTLNSDMSVSPLFKVDSNWFMWGTQNIYNSGFTNVCSYNGLLFYSTATEFCVYDPVLDMSWVYAEYTEGDGYIYSFWYSDGKFYYAIATSPLDSSSAVMSFEPGEVDIPDIGKNFTDLTADDGFSSIVYAADKYDTSAVRVVMVADESDVLLDPNIILCVDFVLGDQTVRSFCMDSLTEGQLEYYYNISVDDDTYSAADGYVLFGMIINNVPIDAYDAVRVTVTSMTDGQMLYEAVHGQNVHGR